MGRMRDRYIALTERGEYEMGRCDWRENRYEVRLQGEAKAAYDLGRCDEQLETILSADGEPH